MKKFVFAIMIVFVFSTLAQAGVEFKSQLTTVSDNKKMNSSVEMLTFAQRGDVRQVFEKVKGDNPLWVEGGYWLFKSANTTMYMVNPKEKTYSEIPIGSMLKFTGVMGKLVKMKIENPLVNVEKIGSESIRGFACTHYRVTVEYDMQVKMAFIKSKSHQRSVKDVWSTREIKALTEIGESFRTKDLKTGFDELDDLIAKQTKAEAALGFPLKMVQETYSTNKKGKETLESTTTMEVVDVAVKNLDASMFEIPAGYKQTQLMPGMGEE
jgi:hypothetical protein